MARKKKKKAAEKKRKRFLRARALSMRCQNVLTEKGRCDLSLILDTFRSFSGHGPPLPTNSGSSVQFEVEIRAGKVHGNGSFESSVDAWYFYAVFEALYRMETCCAGPVELTTHFCHKGTLRQEIRPHQEDSVWTRKSTVNGCVFTHRACPGPLRQQQKHGEQEDEEEEFERCWFDVRMSLAKETVLGPFDAREVSRSSKITNPENGLRVRTRRSLFFRDIAPRWRIDFTHVSTQWPPVVGRPIRDTFEIEFELVSPRNGEPDEPPEELVAQVETLMERVRSSVAGTETEMQRFISNAARNWEVAHSYGSK